MLVGRGAGGRGSLSTFPSSPGPQKCTGEGGDSCWVRRQVTRTWAAPTARQTPGWALCPEGRVERRTPSCSSRGPGSSHRSSHAASRRLCRVTASYLGRSRPHPSVPLPGWCQTVQLGMRSVDTASTAFPGRAGMRPHHLSQRREGTCWRTRVSEFSGSCPQILNASGHVYSQRQALTGATVSY